MVLSTVPLAAWNGFTSGH